MFSNQGNFGAALGQLRPGVGFFDPRMVPTVASYLNVFVDDEETGLVPEGAVVTAEHLETGETYTIPTQEDGVFTFRFVSDPGPVAVYVNAPGYVPRRYTDRSDESHIYILPTVIRRRPGVVKAAAAGLVYAGVLWAFLV